SSDLSDLIAELRADREERRKERKAMEESIKGIHNQLSKTVNDRIRTVEKSLEVYSENTSKSISVLERYPRESHSSFVGFPEAETSELTDDNDLRMNQSDRDLFIDCVSKTQGCRLTGNVHAHVRRDYTADELEQDRFLRREAGKLNAEAGQLEFVVRDLKICRLANPRPLPERSMQALERAQSARALPPLSPSSFPVLSRSLTVAPPRSRHGSIASNGGRGRGGNSRGRGGRGRGMSRDSTRRPSRSSQSHLSTATNDRAVSKPPKRALAADSSPGGRPNKVMNLSMLSPIHSE
ncbi:hypothetical protein PFISCL1PPCAC_11165, partial [Pristionchus fissidentatus]